MKKIIIISIIVLLSLTPLFAFTQFVNTGVSASLVGDENNNFNLGAHLEYSFGLNVSDKASVGFGTIEDMGFVLNDKRDDLIVNTTSISGPAFSFVINPILKFDSTLGVLASFDSLEGDTIYIGPGASLTLTVLPSSERKSGWGFSFGIDGGYGINLDGGTNRYIIGANFGISISFLPFSATEQGDYFYL